jgi:hypothetical protein
MRFFRRDSATDPGIAIAAFWAWWATARDRVAAGIADGSVRTLVDEISEQVQAIDKRLAWELSKGTSARHALVVSPEGDPAVRALAVRWHDAAPAPDAIWEYHPSRQPSELGMLELGGVAIDLRRYRAIAGWDEGRQRLDVRLWHPDLTTAPEPLRMHAAYLFLDNLLGEDAVERWVGTIDLLDDPTSGRSPDELRSEVARRAAQPREDSWMIAERSGGEPAIVRANTALKTIDHPFKHWHLVVTVDRGIEQLRGTDELPELDTAEDRLVEALTATDAVFAGHATERRRRLIHFMCADAAASERVARDWAATEARYGPRVSVEDDPAWAFRAGLGI